MVLVPSNTQPELTTEVVGDSAKQNGGLDAAFPFHSNLQSLCPMASGAKIPTEAIRAPLPSLNGDGEQPLMACVEAEPQAEGQHPCSS